MLGKNPTIRRPYMLLLLVVAIVVSACGSESGNRAPTQVPTAASTSTAAPTPTEEPDEGGGIIRKVRSAPGAVWDGIKWVLGKGSDGVNTVWDGLRSGTGFLWDRVTGLPSATWDVIKSFWRWFVGINLGKIVVSTIDWPVEQISKLNPVNFMQRLLIGFLKLVGIIAVFALVLFGVVRWQLWMHLAQLFWGSAEKGLSKIPTPRHAAKKPLVAKTVTRKPHSPNHEPVADSEPDRDHAKTVYPGSNGFTRDTWTRSQIHELRELVSNQTMIVLFGRASRSNGTPVSDLALMRATGRSRAQIRMDFLSLARVCRTVHPQGELPVETVEATAENSLEAYTIPDQYLEWWFEDEV